MKTELELMDIKAVASTTVEMLKPFLKDSVKPNTGETIFDVRGVAEYLKVETSWVYKQISLRAIPFFKCGKYTRFKKSAVDRWLEQETVNPVPPLKMVNKCR